MGEAGESYTEYLRTRTREELEDIADHVDQDQFPDRYQLVLEQLRRMDGRPRFKCPTCDGEWPENYCPECRCTIDRSGLDAKSAPLELGRSAWEPDDRADTAASFDGEGPPLFKLYLKNVVLTLLTLGVYRFWAQVTFRKFRYQHTQFAGGRFDYHATGKERFVGFLKGLAILSPLLIGLGFLYSSLEPENAFVLCIYAFWIVLWFLRPLIVCGERAFNLSRTSWNNLRFRFTGNVGDLYKLYLGDTLRMIFTLGWYFPWHECKLRAYKLEHTRMGEEGFAYHGRGGELFQIRITGSILTFLTLGLHVPWYVARQHRFHVQNSSFRGRRFHSTLTGGQMFSVLVGGLLMTVLSLGLALPWAMIRYLRAKTDAISYDGSIDLHTIESIHDTKATAVSEGIGQAGEALGQLGDLLGG